jgi:hypothetical protein
MFVHFGSFFEPKPVNLFPFKTEFCITPEFPEYGIDMPHNAPIVPWKVKSPGLIFGAINLVVHRVWHPPDHGIMV